MAIGVGTRERGHGVGRGRRRGDSRDNKSRGKGTNISILGKQEWFLCGKPDTENKTAQKIKRKIEKYKA